MAVHMLTKIGTGCVWRST